MGACKKGSAWSCRVPAVASGTSRFSSRAHEAPRSSIVKRRLGSPSTLSSTPSEVTCSRRRRALVRAGGRIVSVADEGPPDLGATYFVVAPNRDQLVELARLADDGLLRPRIDSVFSLEDARTAFERSMARGKHGKVVLRVADT